MNKQISGACSAILAWVAIDRLVPTRLDSAADIIIPAVVFLTGSTAALATWKGKRWGYVLALIFCGFQIVAVIWLGSYHLSSIMIVERRLAELLMLPCVVASLVLLIKQKAPNQKGPNNEEQRFRPGNHNET